MGIQIYVYKKIRATNIIIYGIIENAGLKVFTRFF
jgi:hypothetical protein